MFLLQERFKLYHFVLTVGTVGSVFLICQPGFIFVESSTFNTPDKVSAAVLAVISGLFASFASILTRFVKDVASVTIVYVQGVITCILLLALFGYKMPSPSTLYSFGMLVITSVAGGMGRFFVIKALKVETAAIVSATLPVELIFTAIMQIFLIGIVPNALTVFGSGMLFLCVSLLPLHDHVMNFCCKKYGTVTALEQQQLISE